MKKRKDNYFDETEQSRKRKSVSDSWIPEKNATTSFTMKGMLMFFMIVVVVLVLKYFF